MLRGSVELKLVSKMDAFRFTTAAAAYIFIHLSIEKERKKRNRRRWWELELYKRRRDYSAHGLLSDLKFQEVSGHYKNFTRMSALDFEILVNLVGPNIAKSDTYMRKAITVVERVALTLRFMASGDSYTSLQYLFKISKQAISRIVPEVCLAISKSLRDYVKVRIH